LYQKICELGWHPFVRIKHGHQVRPQGLAQWYAITDLITRGGATWSGQATCFPTPEAQVSCTLLLCWDADATEPWAIVTDLSTDYPAAIAPVFPQAEHHLCVFHALKAWHRTLRAVYGANYREQHADARALQQDLDRIFRARTKRTAQRRADRVLARRAAYVAADPDMAAVFDSLERHWPKLVNAIESRRIPLTNNATELVNRRFDQHYQNFCRFQTIETAQRYLAIFERTYRLTPFTADAQPRIRGKCPLELAGYDVSAIPLARLLAAQPPDNGSDPPGLGGVPSM
jgi:hypothetical protein